MGDDLDRARDRRGHRCVRDADALLLRLQTTRAAERGKDSGTRFLLRRLTLLGTEPKSRGGQTHDCQCLGWTFRGTNRRWADQALDDFTPHLRRRTGGSWGVSRASRLHTLAQDVQGWMGDFGISDSSRPLPALDQWLRRRVRMGDGTRGRKTRTKVRTLLALGTHTRQALLTASSSKRSWPRSQTRPTPTGMTHEGLRRHGLVTIRACWMQAPGYP